MKRFKAIPVIFLSILIMAFGALTTASAQEGGQPAAQAESVAPAAPAQAAEQPAVAAESEKAKEPEKAGTENKATDENKPEEKKDSREGTVYEGRDQFGGTSIIGSANHVGAAVGYMMLPTNGYSTQYLHIDPRVDLRWKNFGLSLHVPLNLVLYSPDPTVSRWEIRKQDWSSWQDYAQVIRFIQYGRKNDPLYISLNTISSSTLGHGAIMYRYIPNILYDNKKLSLQLDFNSKYAGFESTISGVLYQPLIGLMPFVRPLAFMANDILSSWSIGLTVTADTAAPIDVERDMASFPEFTTRLNPGWNYYMRFPEFNPPAYPAYYPGGKPMIGGNNLPVLSHMKTLFIYGVNTHIKVYKSKSVDIKPYFDYSKMDGAGGGYTVGCLWRFNLGQKLHSFFNIRTDFRAFDSNYEPGYFNSFYEVQKYQYVIPDRRNDPNFAQGKYTTKFIEITRRTGGTRYGYLLEFNYELAKWFGFGFSLDDATGDVLTQSVDSRGNRIAEGNGHFQAHIDLPLPKYFSLHGTYHKVAFKEIGQIFNFSGPNSIFLATMRFSPFNFLGIYGTFQESWELNSTTGLFEMVPSFQAGIDLAYEF